MPTEGIKGEGLEQNGRIILIDICKRKLRSRRLRRQRKIEKGTRETGKKVISTSLEDEISCNTLNIQFTKALSISQIIFGKEYFSMQHMLLVLLCVGYSFQGKSVRITSIVIHQITFRGNFHSAGDERRHRTQVITLKILPR